MAEVDSNRNDTDESLDELKKRPSVFSPEYYDQPPMPTPEEVDWVRSDAGDVIVTGIQPRNVDNWKFEYFHDPLFKAQLARSIVFLTIVLVLSMLMIAAVGIEVYSVFPPIVFALLLAAFTFQYFGIGPLNRPAYVPNFVLRLVDLVPVSGYTENRAEQMREIVMGDDYVPPEQRNQDEDDEEEDMDEFEMVDTSGVFSELFGIEEDTEDKEEQEVQEPEYAVDPVEQYVDDVASPATILTTWMNDDSLMLTKEALHEMADGSLSTYDIDMLLEDNMTMWKNPNVVASLAHITQTHPSQWDEAVANWEEAKGE